MESCEDVPLVESEAGEMKLVAGEHAGSGSRDRFLEPTATVPERGRKKTKQAVYVSVCNRQPGLSTLLNWIIREAVLSGAAPRKLRGFL